jgi:regulator of sirC expression with transglutaminase-like and TPR domain
MRLLSAIVFGTILAICPADASFAAPVVHQKPAESSQAKNLQALRALLQVPDSELDLAKAKVAIDRMIDPMADADAIQQLDALAARIKARFPAGAAAQAKLELLVASLSQPGPWNDYRPFSYDLDDPFGKVIHNKLISTYLTTRKGNCVSMPALLVILGQKLGLDLTLATAPEHVLAKFRNDAGQWINIEATSFGTKSDASYRQEMSISPAAISNGIYLRRLSKRESLAVMMGTLMEFYGQQEGQQDHRIAIADLALQANPKDVAAMLQKGNAYFRMLQERFLTKYESAADIPPAERQEFELLRRNNNLWFERAETLGWLMPDQAQDSKYLQSIQRAKATEQGRR